MGQTARLVLASPPSLQIGAGDRTTALIACGWLWRMTGRGMESSTQKDCTRAEPGGVSNSKALLRLDEAKSDRVRAFDTLLNGGENFHH